MRVAIITESFPPDVNGVAHCVLRVAELLASGGHHPLVIAPQPPRAKRDEKTSYPFPVVRVPAVPLPGYPGFRLGLPGRRVRSALIGHRTEVVHLASPVVLGAHGAAVARRLGLPTVAVYQTDLPSYARAYRLGRAGEAFAWRWLRGIHNGAARTLAPSTVTAAGLLGQGIENVWLWGRGVDTRRFHPAKRSPRIRARLAPDGELIAGYVGRLATEKRVDLLAGITALDGVRLVIVGAGPAEAALRQQLPGAVFLGERRGEELAAIYAGLDVFVHSGPYETFGQTLQEAAASGLPVVAPAAGGPLDLVKDGVTGYLVPPSDPGAFTAAVARLAADPATRAAFGAAGRRKVLGRTWPALTEELPKLTRLGLDRAVADWLNRRTARAYRGVICTTGWAAAEFGRIDAGNLVRVPLGVDLGTFSPGSGQIRTRYVGEGQILLVHCGRLSAEKKPQRSLTTLATLRAAGMPVRLVVAGDGPLRARLVRRAARAGLPVTFAGFLPGRAELAALLASADVAIAPGPAETFGLAALEALACGTPVVVSAESALPEVVGEAGASVPGEDLAAGVRAVLARPERARRAAARARAERYDWGTATRGFLAAHGAVDGAAIRRSA